MSDSKNDHGSDDEDEGKGGKGGGKSRRELPAGAVATLKAWLLSPEHFTHPYPTPQDQVMLMQKTGIDKKQLKNWFTNARRRIWKPMLKKQLEQGKLAATGAGGGGVAVPGVIPGLMVPGQGPVPHPGAEPSPDNPHSVQAMHSHYQHAVQSHSHQPPQPPAQPQQQTYDQHGNPVYMHQQPAPAQPPPAPQSTYTQPYYAPQQQYGQPLTSAPAEMAPSSSIGSLPPMGNAPVATNISAPTMNKTDSHAVLMELFARDQDLVRQATESAKMKATTKTMPPGSDPNQGQQVASQHPMKMGSQTKLMNVPTLNSWPQFSSISSLNNLGTMTGVKSITSMSGADLASQGNLNRMGNLAQVKSMESMGKNDSYAFLEVFFGDRSMSSMNMAGKDQQRGIKREREEDNDVGLSLDPDDSAPTGSNKTPMEMPPTRAPGAPTPAPLPPKGKDPMGDTGTLKRAYDDALAARGLMSVSRSSEKLSDLALPAKMQKTLSQQYLRQHQAQAQTIQSQQQQQQQQQMPQQYDQFAFTPAPAAPPPPAPPPLVGNAASPPSTGSQQYPGQHPQQQQVAGGPQYAQQPSQESSSTANSSGEVHVPSASTCARCHATGVDTQLRPCGHMFHERCLKPSLQVPAGQPKCPICNTLIQSALLAVPTEENANTAPPQAHVHQPPPQQQQPPQWGAPAPPYQNAMSAESSSSKA